jgi:hypothetical protein
MTIDSVGRAVSAAEQAEVPTGVLPYAFASANPGTLPYPAYAGAGAVPAVPGRGGVPGTISLPAVPAVPPVSGDGDPSTRRIQQLLLLLRLE